VFNRFRGYGVPPDKNGDYAFLLHIIASLKSTGKGAVILPHGVLFRGGSEGGIRQNLIERKYIKGIIGLPANLFYGTGIPACVIVVDKENTANRTGIFMIDASKGFIKDGNKNRLREQDVHRIVDVFNRQQELPKYSRFVPFDEIAANEYNLNIPRYIDTQEEEDIQDLNAHLNGGIPNRDVASLQAFWEVYPNLKQQLFAPLRDGYSMLRVDATAIKETIYNHPEFTAYGKTLDAVFEGWKNSVYPTLLGINANTAPKEFISTIAEKLLTDYRGKALIDSYAVYQHLMDYWKDTLKDDVYLLVEDGWVARVRRLTEKKGNKEVDKGWTCDLLPKPYVVDAYFAAEQHALRETEAALESTQAEIAQLEEEHAGEEGLLADATNDNGKLTKATAAKRLKEVKGDPAERETETLLNQVLALYDREAEGKRSLKTQAEALDAKALAQYGKLSEAEVKHLVVDAKWLATLHKNIQGEIDAISQRLTGRIKELAERYESTMVELDASTKTLEANVAEHLKKMGLVWS
jgi:type I restriction enzyme M protein